MDPLNVPRVGRRSALLTVCCLGGAVFFVFPALFLFNQLTPDFAQASAPWLFLALLGLSCGAGAFYWATRLARLTGGPARRQGWAAAAGFGATAPGVVYFLTIVESLAPTFPDGKPVPVHLLFATVFPAAALLVAGTTALAVALARAGVLAGVRTGLAVGVAAMLAFLAVDVAFDLLGMRIGAPGAEKRATMLVVMGFGLLAAALTAGALLGRMLASMREKPLAEAAVAEPQALAS
jgi:hypothetical protein